MIRLATPEDEPHILALARRSPCCGVRLEADWHIKRENPRVPYAHYLAGEACVFSVNRAMALFAGTPQDDEEMAAFLTLTGTRRVFTNGWAPPGWKKEPHVTMCIPHGSADVCIAMLLQDKHEIDENPSINDVLKVIEASEGSSQPPEARDALYTDVNIRRNHGYALVYAIRENGRAVATAGAYAISQTEAYIACVETLPTARRKGYAARLVHALARRFCELDVTLICEEALVDFYKRLGFARTPAVGMIADAPR